MTMKDFRALTWTLVYTYGDDKKGFKVFGCSVPNVAIVHDRSKGKQTKISYRVDRRATDSPSQVVKWINSREKNRFVGSGAQVGDRVKAPRSVEITLHRR